MFLSLTGIVGYLINLVILVIKDLNYPGIFLLMFLEGTLLPIPSEVVMAFSGYLALTNQLPVYFHIPAYILVLLTGTLGNAAGASLAYAIGFYGGRDVILKYGKYIKLNVDTLSKTEKWFQKYGAISVFVTRMIPIFRTFISIPAGLAEMNFKKFLALTIAGTFIWDVILVYLGFIFGSDWRSILGIFDAYTYIMIPAAILIVVYVYLKLRSTKKPVDKKVG